MPKLDENGKKVKGWNRARKKEEELAIFERFKDGDAYIKCWVGTFNANAKKKMKAPFDEWLDLPEEYDIYAIGLQEIVGLNALNVIGPAYMSRPWENKLKKELGPNYVLVCAKQLLGVLLMVFVKKSIFPFITTLQFDTVGVGFLGLGSNKGAVAIRLCIFDTSFLFITSHLAAKKKKVKNRNKNFHEICARIQLHNYKNKFQVPDAMKAKHKGSVASRSRKSSDITSIDNKELKKYMFWMGDLNYRLEVENLAETHRIIEEGNGLKLLRFDQLRQQMAKRNVFKGFREGKIKFQPTYKYQPGTDIYERRPKKKKRFPAWCDRILWLRTEHQDDIKQLYYRSASIPRTSDHKPVSSLFEVKVKVVQDRPTYLPWAGGFIWDLVELLMFILMLGQVAVYVPVNYKGLIETLGSVYFPHSGRGIYGAFVTDFTASIRSVLVPITSEGLAMLYSSDEALCASSSFSGANFTVGNVTYLCPKPGIAAFGQESSVGAFNLYLWNVCLLFFLLCCWSLFYAMQFLARVIGGHFRRRFRWHGRKKYDWWRFQGGTLRMFMVLYYPYIASAFFQLSLGGLAGDSVLLTILAVFSMLFFPNALFAWRVMQLHKLKQQYNSWAIYKNREIKLKFGCLFYEFNEKCFNWALVKLAYIFVNALLIGVGWMHPLVQVIMLVLVQVGYLVALLYFRPYEGAFHNHTQLGYQVLRMVHIFFMMLFLPELGFSAEGQNAIAIVAIMIHSITLAIVICVALFIVGQHLRGVACPCGRDKSMEELAENLDDTDNPAAKQSVSQSEHQRNASTNNFIGLMMTEANELNSMIDSENDMDFTFDDKLFVPDDNDNLALASNESARPSAPESKIDTEIVIVGGPTMMDAPEEEEDFSETSASETSDDDDVVDG